MQLILLFVDLGIYWVDVILCWKYSVTSLGNWSGYCKLIVLTQWGKYIGVLINEGSFHITEIQVVARGNTNHCFVVIIAFIHGLRLRYIYEFQMQKKMKVNWWLCAHEILSMDTWQFVTFLRWIFLELTFMLGSNSKVVRSILIFSSIPKRNLFWKKERIQQEQKPVITTHKHLKCTARYHVFILFVEV